MTESEKEKKKFYFKSEKDGLWHFRCIFCGDVNVAGRSTQREYDPARCVHPELKKLADKGILCSSCFNWDFDRFKRHDSSRPTNNRLPLRHKSGRQLGKDGWLDDNNNTLDSFS